MARNNEGENPLYGMIREGLPADMHQLHVVGFKFPDDVSTADQAELMKECRSLYDRCGGRDAGIISMSVQENLDPRKGFTWVEVMVFESAQAFINFHAHPAHQDFGQKAAKTADVWVVLDIPIWPGAVLG